jgi:putative transposase
MSELKSFPTEGARYSINGELYEASLIEPNGFIKFRGVGHKAERSIHTARFVIDVRSGLIKLVSRAPVEISNAPIEMSLNDVARKKYLRKLAYVQAAIRSYKGEIKKSDYPQFVKSLAEKIADSKPPSYSALYNWLRIYRLSGNNPLSLAVNEARPPTRRTRLDGAVAELMHEFIQTEYLKNTRPSAMAIYSMFVAEIESNNAKREPLQKLPIPSSMTFYRAISRIEPYVIDITRFGRQMARKNYKYGKNIFAPERLGQRVEADCHLMDVLIVDDEGEVIGRPYLCALIDVYSRCIMGHEISFSPPSAAKVLRALRSSLVDFPMRPYSGLPEELILDNGAEFQNATLQNVARTYGIELRYVEPRSPDQKPHIERFFGTLNSSLVHMMPGTTRSNPTDRGEYDSEKMATFTLEKLKNLVNFWLDSVYHKQKHSGINMPPCEMWRIASQVIEPQHLNAVDVAIKCRSMVLRSIHGGRVKISDLAWTGPSLPLIASRLAAKGDSEKVPVYFDETDLSTVWVQDPTDQTKLYQADAVNTAYQNGLTLYEHGQIRNEIKLQGRKFSDESARAAKKELHTQMAASGKRVRKKRARAGLSLSDVTVSLDSDETTEELLNSTPRKNKKTRAKQGAKLSPIATRGIDLSSQPPPPLEEEIEDFETFDNRE